MVRALYDGDHCWTGIGPQSFHVCLALTGVAQVCLRSGTLWAPATASFVDGLASVLALPSRSKARRPQRDAQLLGPGWDAELGVCADDMGIALWEICLLTPIGPHVHAMGRLACLHLQPRKCVFVPLWVAAADLSAALMDARAVRCVGFVPGSGSACGDSWRAATKYKQRASVLKFVPVSTAELITLCNGSVIAVLACLAQLPPLPADLLKCEPHTMHRILKAPPKSFASGDLLNMGEWAPGPALKALPAAWAAAWMTAEVALRGGRDFAVEWHGRAFDVLPARTVREGRWAALVWTQRQSMAQYMLSVTRGAMKD
ncbi:unnamed protein product, partial [Prorocentrum cordatum]